MTPINRLCLHYWPGTLHSETASDGSFGQTPTYLVCLQALACGVQSRSHWYVTGSGCQPEDRHIAIHAFPATGHRLVGFVPYADVASTGGFAHESAPGLKVRRRPVGREPLQMLRAPPVADHDGRPPEPLLVAQQSSLRRLGQVGGTWAWPPPPLPLSRISPPVGGIPIRKIVTGPPPGSAVNVLRALAPTWASPIHNAVTEQCYAILVLWQDP